MSHEKSITITRDGKHYNIPSVINGKQVSAREAEAYAVKNNSLGKAYNTIESAVEAAKKRSSSFDGTVYDTERKKQRYDNARENMPKKR